jgi:hypothetical protein
MPAAVAYLLSPWYSIGRSTPLVAWIVVVGGVTGALIALVGWSPEPASHHCRAKQWGLTCWPRRTRSGIALPENCTTTSSRASTWLGWPPSARPRQEARQSWGYCEPHPDAGARPPSAGAPASRLGDALLDLVTRHRSPDGPDIELDAAQGITLPNESAVALYRVAQEALTNALKHAAARAIRFTLRGDAHAVTLTIEDDGRGMPPSTEKRASFGLRSIRERLGAVGGSMTTERASPTGTRLVATVPRK